MKALRVLALVLSCLLAAASAGGLFVALTTSSSAAGALRSALELRSARIELADAQDQVGESDLGDVVAGARDANTTALGVGEATQKILDLLRPTAAAAKRSIASARAGARGATLTRRQTTAAAEVLATISAYQTSASRYSALTNRDLMRILEALRKTNESFERP